MTFIFEVSAVLEFYSGLFLNRLAVILSRKLKILLPEFSNSNITGKLEFDI